MDITIPTGYPAIGNASSKAADLIPESVTQEYWVQADFLEFQNKGMDSLSPEKYQPFGAVYPLSFDSDEIRNGFKVLHKSRRIIDGMTPYNRWDHVALFMLKGIRKLDWMRRCISI